MTINEQIESLAKVIEALELLDWEKDDSLSDALESASALYMDLEMDRYRMGGRL